MCLQSTDEPPSLRVPIAAKVLPTRECALLLVVGTMQPLSLLQLFVVLPSPCYFLPLDFSECNQVSPWGPRESTLIPLSAVPLTCCEAVNACLLPSPQLIQLGSFAFHEQPLANEQVSDPGITRKFWGNLVEWISDSLITRHMDHFFILPGLLSLPLNICDTGQVT